MISHKVPWPRGLGPACLWDKMLCDARRNTHPLWAFCIKRVGAVASSVCAM